MSFKIQNWKLSLLAFIFIGVFTSLGMWQLSRASEKKILLKSFAERTELAPLDASSLSQYNDLRFYRATLQGTFDNAHSILLDNKISQGKVGYEVYTPFYVIGLKKPLLVDRGFTPIINSRKEMPVIPAITGIVTITGMLNLPPTYVALGEMIDTPTHHWPLRVEYINLTELSTVLNDTMYPYVLNITPKDAAALEVNWQVVTMSPEKHMGYALQWFAFAVTLLILFVTLNRQKNN